jgi:hypothetical protein
MGIYTDDVIIGLRILQSSAQWDGAFYVKHSFTEEDWKEKSMQILPDFLGKSDAKIQTLHTAASTLDPNIKYWQIWVDNPDITVEKLLMS